MLGHCQTLAIVFFCLACHPVLLLSWMGGLRTTSQKVGDIENTGQRAPESREVGEIGTHSRQVTQFTILP